VIGYAHTKKQTVALVQRVVDSKELGVISGGNQAGRWAGWQAVRQTK